MKLHSRISAFYYKTAYSDYKTQTMQNDTLYDYSSLINHVLSCFISTCSGMFSQGQGSAPSQTTPIILLLPPILLLMLTNRRQFSKDFVDILDDNTVWATDKPTFISNGRSGKPFWVHSVCVIFCPLTRFDETTNSWLGVSREYHRARCLTCVECKKKGASIGCEVPTCNVSCHFPCAIKVNDYPTNTKDMRRGACLT